MFYYNDEDQLTSEEMQVGDYVHVKLLTHHVTHPVFQIVDINYYGENNADVYTNQTLTQTRMFESGSPLFESGSPYHRRARKISYEEYIQMKLEE